MELRKSALIVADISGYTNFVVLHRLSILHGEQIITELMEVIATKARYPLRLNKLEGDAAFFVAPIESPDAGGLDDIVTQVRGFFDAFRAKQAQMLSERTLCKCEACESVEKLRLKAIVHVGEVVEKMIGELKEVAGESVILVHRLLKNSVGRDEYLLLTRAAADGISADPFPIKRSHTERVEQLGDIEVVVYYPDEPPLERPVVTPRLTLRGIGNAMATTLRAAKQRALGPRRAFRNLPR